MKADEAIRVLLVDDERSLLQYMGKRLADEGFSVESAASGEEAVEVVKKRPFDVAVVDLKMPGMDGVTAQRQLKEIQPFLQCIVLTGHGSVESALESGQLDAFRYLLKPADYPELVRSIREAHGKKLEIQGKAYERKVEELSKAGLGPRALKTALEDVRKAMGMED